MTVKNNWLENATNNLLNLSIATDFASAKKEWVYVGIRDNKKANFLCQLCGNEKIRYEYNIKNVNNENTMIVGSTCILKFIDNLAYTQDNLYDKQKNIINKARLDKDKKEYFTFILFRALDANFSSNKFQRGITSQIKEDSKLNIKQAMCMIDFFNKDLNDKEKTAYKEIIHINLKKEYQRDQYLTLDNDQKIFINSLLNSQQRKVVKNL